MVKVTILLKTKERILFEVEYDRKTSKGFPRFKPVIQERWRGDNGVYPERNEYVLNITGPSKQIWNEEE